MLCVVGLKTEELKIELERVSGERLERMAEDADGSGDSFDVNE